MANDVACPDQRLAHDFPLGGSATFALEQEAVMRRSARTAVFATAAVAMSTALARAEHASVTLSYTSAKSATSCPDENTFRGLVAARLGYDPFVGAGVRTLTVDFERRGQTVVGRLDLSADGDARAVERTLRTGADDCFELATSMALVVAVAIDPNASPDSTPAPAREAPDPVPPTPVTPPAPKAPESAAPARSDPAPARPHASDRPRRSGINVRFEFGGLVAWGVVPAAAAGTRGGVALDFGTWSVGAEGTLVTRGSRANPHGPGDVSGVALAGALTSCVDPVNAEAWGLELCAVGSVGALRSTAKGVARAAPSSTLLANLGPRVATRVMFSQVLGVGIAAEAPVALSRAHLHIEKDGARNEVWAQPALGFMVAASLVASIP
jgi:hypothetical protein